LVVVVCRADRGRPAAIDDRPEAGLGCDLSPGNNDWSKLGLFETSLQVSLADKFCIELNAPSRQQHQTDPLRGEK
jgi:hypothetical protein